MSQLSRTEWEALYGTTGTVFPDNTTGEISEGDMRTFGKNASDSIPFTRNDSYTWASPQVSASGTNTYTATPSPAIAAYATGQEFKIKFTNASTGVSTLNLNGLGAKKIFINPTTQATTDHILAGQIVKLAYDAALDSASGGFLMLGSAATSGSTAAENVTFTPAGNIAATDVQAALEELDSETLVGRASANTTGVAVSFAVPQIYGTPGSPETGNITLVTTGLVQGIVQTMYHQNGTEPTYPSEFVRLGSGTYSTAVRNIIFMHAVSTTRIEYVVTQEQ